MNILSIQCKLKDSIYLEASCGSWNRLILGATLSNFHSCSLFLTAVNIPYQDIQYNVKHRLCGCVRPTVYSLCSAVALSQEWNTYRHDQVLGLLELLANASMRASESLQGTIPSSSILTPYHLVIVIHNVTSNSVALLELTCRLVFMQHLETARDHKQYQ